MMQGGARCSLCVVAWVCVGCEASGDLSADPDAAQDGPRGEAATFFDTGPSQPLDATSPTRDAELSSEPRIDASLDAASGNADACVADGAAPRLGEAVVMHACLHGSDGPFRVVTGTSSAESAPDVSRAHTLFTVLAVAGESVHVRYLPAASGDHVLFMARGALTAARQASSSLALESRAVDCAVLPDSYLMQLAGLEPVELTLRAASDRVAMVIESLAGWGADGWQHACGASPATTTDAGACRKSGPCSRDAECCSFCHDYDHCH
ncbi:MAG TPA: hypothetical protein VFX59_29405 [Polyangiales bacterium]|nr:hypothetical protein [Polyangiales bacterium]